MGGCRCSFRECSNRTGNGKKLHYFHFPVKDPSRLKIWAAYANRPEFINLPHDKLKNKVVCQLHFERKMFMNDLRDRLINMAVPKLLPLNEGYYNLETLKSVKSDDGEPLKKEEVVAMEEMRKNNEVDIESLEIEYVESNIPCEGAINVTVTETIEEPPIEVPSQTKLHKMYAVKPIILNKTLLNSAKNALYTIPAKLTDGTGEQRRTGQIKINLPGTGPSLPKMPRLEPESVPDPDPVSEIQTLEEQTIQPVYLNTDISSKLEETAESIDEMKRLLMDFTSRAESRESKATTSQPKASASTMNKLQLFNGIKRHLHPTMVAILSMELFGTADRQWEPEEKSFILDLLNLGENVYDHFADEYRFRLPPKNVVRQWQMTTNEIHAVENE